MGTKYSIVTLFTTAGTAGFSSLILTTIVVLSEKLITSVISSSPAHDKLGYEKYIGSTSKEECQKYCDWLNGKFD